MTDTPKNNTRKAKNGEPMDEAFWRRAEDEAEKGLDPSRLRRRPGRPPLGSEPAEVTAVRLPPPVRRALEERATAEHTTASDVVRRALERYLNEILGSKAGAGSPRPRH